MNHAKRVDRALICEAGISNDSNIALLINFRIPLRKFFHSEYAQEVTTEFCRIYEVYVERIT